MPMNVINIPVGLHTSNTVCNLACTLDIASRFDHRRIKDNFCGRLNPKRIRLNFNDTSALHMNVIAFVGVQGDFAALYRQPVATVFACNNHSVIRAAADRDDDVLSTGQRRRCETVVLEQLPIDSLTGQALHLHALELALGVTGSHRPECLTHLL
ncbi:hypothetical protein PF66_02285 [Pseudomonas asplenii]|uniref:Uncharacterized protein n=1 Tax=Pseudomonas asplenii TaxID=53407 RepID=A0A0N0VKA8_9PSED|nr:hypothetical protein PF66_02285 [Pseudomonas fuscovaginae]